MSQNAEFSMGYFSNGSEGMDYEERYCSRCIHHHGSDIEKVCPVWMAHMIHNYDECNNKDSILHLLIPRTKDNLWNEQCAMFHPAKPAEDPNQIHLPLC